VSSRCISINEIIDGMVWERKDDVPDVPVSEYEGVACTCGYECNVPCKGTCGCEACHNCYMDFLSSE